MIVYPGTHGGKGFSLQKISSTIFWPFFFNYNFHKYTFNSQNFAEPPAFSLTITLTLKGPGVPHSKGSILNPQKLCVDNLCKNRIFSKHHFSKTKGSTKGFRLWEPHPTSKGRGPGVHFSEAPLVPSHHHPNHQFLAKIGVYEGLLHQYPPNSSSCAWAFSLGVRGDDIRTPLRHCTTRSRPFIGLS